MRKLVALALSCAMVFSMTACGSKDNGSKDNGSKSDSGKTTFTVGFDAEYPPYGYMDDSGEYTGFDLELAQAVCDI